METLSDKREGRYSSDGSLKRMCYKPEDVKDAIKNTLEDLECYMGYNTSSCIEVKKILKHNFGDVLLGADDA